MTAFLEPNSLSRVAWSATVDAGLNETLGHLGLQFKVVRLKEDCYEDRLGVGIIARNQAGEVVYRVVEKLDRPDIVSLRTEFLLYADLIDRAKESMRKALASDLRLAVMVARNRCQSDAAAAAGR